MWGLPPTIWQWREAYLTVVLYEGDDIFTQEGCKLEDLILIDD